MTFWSRSVSSYAFLEVIGRFESKYIVGMYVRSLKALLRVVGPIWEIVVAVVDTQTYAGRAFDLNTFLFEV